MAVKESYAGKINRKLTKKLRVIAVAAGREKADLVLKNATYVNVFSNELCHGDIAVAEGLIVGMGEYSGNTEVDMGGKIVLPGFVDAHIHLESSLVSPTEFAKAVLPHGTTTVITDPHEIANVMGTDGIEYMLQATEDLPVDVRFMLPSCVPATGLDESGAVLEAEQLRPYYQQPRVLGLAELMNSYGTVRADEKILQKIRDCTAAGKKIDGHAPFLSGEELNAYVAAGVQSDHECSDIHEAMEKLRRGQYIMVREGTAAQNMDSLLPLFREPYCSRCMLVTDDKHPGDLLQGGHIDYIIRKAIAAGVDPVVAVRMGTLVPCQYFGLAHSGAVAPGYTADLIVLSNLEKFTVEQVYKKGKLVAQQGKMLHPAALAVDKARFARVFDSFNMDEITPEQLQLKQTGTRQRVICLTPHSLLTTEKIVPFCQHPGTAPGVDVTQQIVKLAVFERHHRSGHVGLGFLGNYGLQRGAVASSIAHDSHNLIVAGTNDADMVLAGNTVRKNKGGLAFALNGQVVGELPLPVAGLMSTESAEAVEEKLQSLKAALKAHGISEDIDAFMTLAFVSLPVIPKLRLNTYGIVDVDAQQIVPAVF